MRKENNIAISLLRIMACFLIVRGHYYEEFGLQNTILKGVILGAGPVAIFFVISGFLAYFGFDKNADKDGVKNYYIKRASRIIPPYYLVLLLCMAFDGFWGIVTNNTIGLGWLRYFTFTNMILPSDSFWIYNDLYGFWTMGCFPIFYLLVPLLYKWLDRKNGVFELLYSGIILNILVKGLVTKLLPSFGVDEIGSFSNLNPLSTLYLFIFGMCVANGKLKNAEKKAMSALATAFMVMLVFEKNGYVLWGLASAFICLTSDYFKVPSQFIESIWYRVLMFLDNISFYVYLTHLLVANIVKSLINLHGGIGAAISLATSVAVSAALNKVFSTILLFKRTPKTL